MNSALAAALDFSSGRVLFRLLGANATTNFASVGPDCRLDSETESSSATISEVKHFSGDDVRLGRPRELARRRFFFSEEERVRIPACFGALASSS